MSYFRILRPPWMNGMSFTKFENFRIRDLSVDIHQVKVVPHCQAKPLPY